MIYGEILKIIHFYYFDPTPDFLHFYYMFGGYLGSLLYGDVSVMKLSETHADLYISYIRICLTKVLS